MAVLPLLLLIIIKHLTIFSYQFSSATDIITPSQPLADGSTLVSKDGSFELGFFNPPTSTKRYVGIWFHNIPHRTIVWVANRDNPILDNSSMLTINTHGNLVLLSQNKSVLWSANSTISTASSPNPIVQLLDSGNLVVRDENQSDPESFIWQSFDYPCDTFLAGMKLGWDLKKGIYRRLTAWRNWDDPSPGDFTCNVSFGSIPELFMWKGSSVYHRSGPWNGLRFSSAPILKQNQIFDIQFLNNQNEAYYTFTLKNKSLISTVVLNQTTFSRQRFVWFPENQAWSLYLSVPGDDCDAYNRCGPYGNCVVGQLPICQCLNGFVPKSPQNWDATNWTQGCVRSEPWQCGVKGRDGFKKFSGLKLPDATNSWANQSMTLEECKAKCLNNCSCMAYANLDIRGEGSGCAIWFGDLIDIRMVQSAGQDLYIRMAVSDTDAVGSKKKMALVISFTILLLLVLLFTFFYFHRRKRKSREKTMSTEMKDECEQEDMELPLFELDKIVNATKAFSTHNKLGEGGFGPVYRGKLEDGQEIAVKRLSKSSHQGLKEFKNEVILCSKLQHRNLVKVLGCCIQGEEKMLIYEYMPNKSLDSFLFDDARSQLLDWSKRFNIIYGVARGLLYLHHDSRLRIIHRDLKASNVLLDSELNPKISDFGMARMFGGDQIEGNTSKVAGTFGYMAPEYAIDGLFSIKSDVFSFGILLLEIISGKKNKGVYYPNQTQNLIGYAWKLWKQGNPMKLIDASFEDSCTPSEVLRCIQIGLLCVQQHPNDRPNMASVVVMLSSENALSQPKEPGLLIDNFSMEGQSYGNEILSSSTNEITITLLEAR